MQDALVTWLQSIPQVRKVNYSEMTANTLSGLNLLIAYVSMGIIVILLAVSIFLISNTVAIGISVRSEEINIMKYIGATDFFVRAPFVLEGMLIGLIGAAVPLGLIYSLYNYALNYIVERFMVLSGFLNFRTPNNIVGFIFNRLPPQLVDEIKALCNEAGTEFLGYFPNSPELSLIHI